VRSEREEQLVDAARLGDHEAWETLYRGLYPRLRGFVMARVGPTATEDVVNETMTRAVAGIGRFHYGTAGFDGWVFGIAKHVIVDHHRTEERRRRQSDAHRRSDPAALPDMGDPSDGLVLDEDHRHVRTMFAQLSDRDRELLQLRVVAGLTVEQCAEILHQRPGTVRTAQSRALARLRTLMETTDAHP
jgi:RNA polymerase sigma-70 factor (ECF subfamily)